MVGEHIDLRAFGGLERDVKHLSERIDDLEKSVDRLETSIRQLTTILDQARGARWFFLAIVGGVSFLAGIAASAKGLLR